MVDLSLDEIPLERAVLEIRYPPSFLHWDRAGALWTEVARRWPDIRNDKATPVSTVFSLGNLQFVAEVGQARVTAVEPERSLEHFSEMARDYFSVVASHLEVRNLARIGFRVIYFQKTKDLADASQKVIATKLLRTLPDDLLSLRSARASSPAYVMRLEDESVGVRVSLQAGQQDLPLGDPRGSGPRNGVEYDIDYYTLQVIDLQQWQVQEWIKNVLHLLRRDTPKVLAG